MQTTTLKLKARTVEWINGLLSGQIPHDEKDANTMVEWTARFPDGYECDLKVVSGGRTGEEDADTPYLDPVLFDPSGREVSCLQDESENIVGEYQWDLADGSSYLLVVEQED